jgi:Ca2+-binding EF-hand superfamily protein
MGLLCSCADEFRVNATRPGQGYRVLEVAFELGLNRWDVDKLYKSFQVIDSTNRGKISILEFATFNKCNCEAFCAHIFNVCDKSDAGEVTFEKYLITMWNLLVRIH